MAKILDPAILNSSDEEEESSSSDALNLQHEYTLWVFMNSLANDGWKPKKMASFGNITQFWNVYQHMKRPNELEHGTMINLFVKGIEPAWEDPANQHGGRW